MDSLSDPREDLTALTEDAKRDLAALWQLNVTGASAEQVRDFLMSILPELGMSYGDAAAALAADWFDFAREEAGAPGSFTPVLAPEPTPARWEALARWGVDPLFHENPRPADALTLIQGGLQRTVADQHRMTIARSAIADPASKGWKRIGIGDSCEFCAKLLARGGVYTSASVHFRSHDHCNCAAAPAWKSTPAIDISHVRDDFTHSTRFRTDEARIKNARLLRDS